MENLYVLEITKLKNQQLPAASILGYTDVDAAYSSYYNTISAKYAEGSSKIEYCTVKLLDGYGNTIEESQINNSPVPQVISE